MKKVSGNLLTSIADIEITLVPALPEALRDHIENRDRVPLIFRRHLVDGAQIRLLQYDFGTVLIQKLVSGQNVFWIIQLSLSRSVTLHPRVNKLLFSFNYMLHGTVVSDVMNHHVELREGTYQLYGMAADVLYEASFARGDYLLLCVGIPYNRIPELANAFADLGDLMELYRTNQLGFHYPHLFDITAVIRKHIEDMLSNRPLGESRFRNFQHLIWQERLLHLFMQYLQDKEKLEHTLRRGGGSDLQIEQLNDYLNDHLGESDVREGPAIDVKEILRRMNVSGKQLRRLIREKYKCSWATFVHHARMKKAQALIDERPELSVSAIADKLGYSELSHFSRAFKSHFGKSPREWREANRGV